MFRPQASGETGDGDRVWLLGSPHYHVLLPEDQLSASWIVSRAFELLDYFES